MRVYVVRFVDSAHVDWQVREETLRPEGSFAGVGAWYRRQLRFESANEVRQLHPVPDRWAERSPAELETLCRAAVPCEPATRVSA